MLDQCIRRLAREPHSLYRANALGDDAWFGWTREAALLAEVVDMTAFVASAAGQNKKAKHKPVMPRPESKPKRVISTRDDVGAALAGLLG